MKKFRLTKSGQLRQLSNDEMDEAFSKDDRWTVRPVFVILVALMFAGISCLIFFVSLRADVGQRQQRVVKGHSKRED
jgi:hypothetical protein